MSTRVLVDTDVLIEYLRGQGEAVDFLESLKGELLISAVTIAELFSGARGSEERDALDRFILAFDVISVDEQIAKSAGQIRQDYRVSHGPGLADALIAASALDREAELVTFNQRHYPMVERLRVPYER